MKPLKERLAEKAARLAKEEKKLSGPVKSYRFSLPYSGYPYMSKQSDTDYVRGRALALVKKIRNSSASPLYEGLKEAVNAEEKRLAEARTHRSWWEPQENINDGISKYIVVVKKEDGTITDEYGKVWTLKVPTTVPETTAPTPAPMAEQLFQRVNDLDRRTRELQEQTPSSVERAHRLLEDANALEVDIQEVLTQLSSDLETPDDTDEMLTVVQQTFDNPTSPPVNELLNNLPTSGVALTHTVQNNIEANFTPEQEDAIIQPSIQHIQPISEHSPLPEGLTFPMDYVYSVAASGTVRRRSLSDDPEIPSRSLPQSLRRPLARSARRRRNIIRQAATSEW